MLKGQTFLVFFYIKVKLLVDKYIFSRLIYIKILYRRVFMTKKVGRRILLIVAILVPLMLLLGCAGKEWAPKHAIWYYHPELPAADRAVEEARKAGKNTECPAEFDMVRKMLEQSYVLYKECKTKEAIDLAKETEAKAKALCPKEDPCKVLKECMGEAPAMKEATFTIDSAHFDFDKSSLNTSSKAKTQKNMDELQKAISFIKAHQGATVVIEGHTDSVGSQRYNLGLSMRRANAVKQYLVKEGGIDPAAIQTKGLGEVRPVASNKTDEGRAKNRRAEIHVFYQ